jgi:hypothetical protein
MTLLDRYCYFHGINEETEAQRRWVASLRSNN